MSAYSPDWRPITIARILGVASVCLLVLGAASLGVFRPADLALESFRYQLNNKPVSGDVVLVEIDAASLQSVGVWPWPRALHAQMLDRLMDLGSAEVVFDIDFSATSTPEGDLALEQALERAGGYAYLAAFRQLSRDGGQPMVNQSLARFARHAEPVLVNVETGAGGLVDAVTAGLPSVNMVSTARALVPDAPPTPQSQLIDFSFDLSGVDRISADQLLNGDVDPGRLANKQVIIGASALELRDIIAVPRFGMVAGPLVQIAAIETLKSGRVLVSYGAFPAIGLLSLLGLLMFARRGRLSLHSQILLGLGLSVLSELSAWLLLSHSAVLVDTVPLHAGIAGLLMLAFLEERSVRWRASRRQQQRLAYLASHDALTGALSYTALCNAVDARLARGEETSVVLIELGRLDLVRTSLGHDVVDAAVLAAAARLRLDYGQSLARMADDRLAIALPANETTAIEHATKIATMLDAPYHLGGHMVILSTRFGLACSLGKPIHPAELLRRADVALATARSATKQVIAYDPQLGAAIKRRQDLDSALRGALARDEFHLLFQPQVDLGSEEMIGVEALVRWQPEGMSAVSPAAFIPLAEETGLIIDLGDWVLKQACRQAASWAWSGRLSVNVSAVQFRLGDVVKSVREALALSGFPANRLDLEITESVFVGNDGMITNALEELRQMGISIALDDFGTGYSSLSYLAHLPIDKLKIDQSFVRDLPNPDSRIIIDTIVQMGRRLNKVVIAEGIETDAQYAYLASTECDMGQGYLFGRPQTAQALGLTSDQVTSQTPDRFVA